MTLIVDLIAAGILFGGLFTLIDDRGVRADRVAPHGR